MSGNFPISVPALRITQPMGSYFVVVLSADVLLKVAYSDRLSARFISSSAGYVLEGTQRELQLKRLSAIADYINRDDAAFPNTIILAANFRRDNSLIEDEDAADGYSRRWYIEEKNGVTHLTIPSEEQLAAVIDGQHRLFAFAEASRTRESMELICSVFLDLPRPYQAQLFATINSTQKPVDKSLTYELFGYNIEPESEAFWGPDKLAVYLSRRLHVDADSDSPLRNRIRIAPLVDPSLVELPKDDPDWSVSTAVVVEGILRLITTNPKKDSAELLSGGRHPRTLLAERRKDPSPLRDIYINSQDIVLYTLVLNYLKAANDILWRKAKKDSFIIKTVGIQAIFDILRRKLAKEAMDSRDISVLHFKSKLEPAGSVDFSEGRFKSASGMGRTLIRAELEKVLSL